MFDIPPIGANIIAQNILEIIHLIPHLHSVYANIAGSVNREKPCIIEIRTRYEDDPFLADVVTI